MSVPSWDLFIIIFIVIAVGFGFIMQRDRVVSFMLSIYAGIVVSNAVVEPVRLFFTGNKTLADSVWIQANVSPFAIQTIVFLLVAFLVAGKSGLGGKGTRGLLSPVELTAYSFFNAVLLLAAIASFMPPEIRQGLQETSKMANFIITYKLFLTIAPVILVIVTGGIRRTSSYD